PEVGIFTQTHTQRPPVPWDQISIGELVWMKWKGGPVVATARVQGFRQVPECTPERLRATTTGYRLYELLEYWSSRPPVFFGMTIYLADERWLDKVFTPKGRSRGESWIVVRTPEQERLWLTDAPENAHDVDPSGKSNRPGRGSRTVPLTLRFEVFRRDDFRCTYCGRKPPEVVLHVDHV